MKILVVDDVGYSRHYHTRLAQKFGYEAVPADGGTSALKMLQQDMTINVVLTDLIMRDMDGLALFRQSQQINRTTDNGNSTPPAFILMTALRPNANNPTQHKDLDKLRVAKDLGFVEVLLKPIDPDHLRKILETIQFASGKSEVDVTGIVARMTSDFNKLATCNDNDAILRVYDEIKPLWDQLEQLAAVSA